MNRHPFKRLGNTLLATFVLGGTALAAPAGAAEPPPATKLRKLEAQNQALSQTVEAMRQMLLDLKQQVAEMKQQASVLTATQQSQTEQARQSAAAQQTIQAQVTAANEGVAQALAQTNVQATQIGTWQRLSLWGYGEVYYAHPTHQANQTTLDLARGVFGIGYQFDDKTRFNSEYEIEHAVASADDPGEVEIEQFYVDRQVTDGLSVRAGLFLIPAGLLNENHEPTYFYGVQRNFVETLIIPSTWREGGISVFGSTEAGLDWNLGLTTGVDLSKWNFSPEVAPYSSALQLIASSAAPLQATHQEGAFANAEHLSGYLALNYRGVPGLTLGGSVFGGGATPALPGIGAQKVALAEVHGRYQTGPWDLSALYAQGRISGTGAANRLVPGAANPLPARFDGGYLQAAYTLWQGKGMRLAPFGRYERYDMGASYEGLAPGFGATPSGFPIPRDRVATVGTNFYLNPDVVLKLDYQQFQNNKDFTRFDLGLGLAF